MYVLDPIHYNLVVESAVEVMQRIQLSNPDAPLPKPGELPTGRIIIPDSSASDGVGSDSAGDRKGRNSQGGAILNLLVGRVVWVGPGKQFEGAFVKPTVKRGELVLFSPRVVSHELRVHGKSYKVLPWSECLAVVREVAYQEWLRSADPVNYPLLEAA